MIPWIEFNGKDLERHSPVYTAHNEYWSKGLSRGTDLRKAKKHFCGTEGFPIPKWKIRTTTTFTRAGCLAKLTNRRLKGPADTTMVVSSRNPAVSTGTLKLWEALLPVKQSAQGWGAVLTVLDVIISRQTTTQAPSKFTHSTENLARPRPRRRNQHKHQLATHRRINQSIVACFDLGILFVWRKKAWDSTMGNFPEKAMLRWVSFIYHYFSNVVGWLKKGTYLLCCKQFWETFSAINQSTHNHRRIEDNSSRSGQLFTVVVWCMNIAINKRRRKTTVTFRGKET